MATVPLSSPHWAYLFLMFLCIACNKSSIGSEGTSEFPHRVHPECRRETTGLPPHPPAHIISEKPLYKWST